MHDIHGMQLGNYPKQLFHYNLDLITCERFIQLFSLIHNLLKCVSINKIKY